MLSVREKLKVISNIKTLCSPVQQNYSVLEQHRKNKTGIP